MNPSPSLLPIYTHYNVDSAENGTFVEFKDQLKSVIVNTTNSSINWDGQVNVKFSPPPSFLFRLDLKILVFSGT